MPTVTDIKQQLKNPNKLSVFIDNKYSFSLTLDQLTEHKKIRIGKDISPEELNSYKDLSKLTNQYLRMVNLIYIRPRSEYEVTTKLKQKKVTPEEIEDLTTKLKANNYLNDQKFAEWWVSSRKSSKPISRLKLQSELAAKGIKSELAQEVISLHFSKDEENDILKQLIEKKKSKYPDQQKLMAYLASKGFNYSQIKQALASSQESNF